MCFLSKHGYFGYLSQTSGWHPSKVRPSTGSGTLQIRIRPDLAGRTWHDKLEVAPRVFWGPGDWLGKSWPSFMWLVLHGLPPFKGVGFTPWKIKMLNLKITQSERKIIWTYLNQTSMTLGSMFQGVSRRNILRGHSQKRSVFLFQSRCLSCIAIITNSWQMPKGEG